MKLIEIVQRKGHTLSLFFLLAFTLGLPGEGAAMADTRELAASAPATNQETGNAIKLSEQQLLEVIRGLVAAGDFEKAKWFIQAARPNTKDQASLDFLEAHMAERGGDLAEANEIYRNILHSDPGLARVRLSLARNLFVQKKDRAARYHYEYALAGDLPPVIQQLIRHNLATMRTRQRWVLNFGASLTSNSNVNTGPDQSHLDMYGLSFELSEDARQTSGNGVSAWASGKWLIGSPKEMRLRSEAGFHVAEYEGRLYDQVSTWIGTGPQWQTSRETVWLAATASDRWIGGEHYQQTLGARARLERMLPNNKLVVADIAYRSVDNARRSYDDGRQVSLALSFSTALDAHSRGRIFSRSGWHLADQAAWSWSRLDFGVSWMREFPHGITVEVSPELSVQRWQAPHPAFNTVRQDRHGRVSFSLKRRDWRVFGFVPVLGYEYFKTQSSIQLYQFDRHWMTFGVARSL